MVDDKNISCNLKPLECGVVKFLTRLNVFRLWWRNRVSSKRTFDCGTLSNINSRNYIVELRRCCSLIRFRPNEQANPEKCQVFICFFFCGLVANAKSIFLNWSLQKFGKKFNERQNEKLLILILQIKQFK